MAKKAEPTHRFELDGKIIELDINALTFGEIEEVESYFDRSIGEIDWNSGRALLMVAYIARKRKNPETTLDDLRDIKINTIKEAPAPKRPTKQPETSGDQS